MEEAIYLGGLVKYLVRINPGEVLDRARAEAAGRAPRSPRGRRYRWRGSRETFGSCSHSFHIRGSKANGSAVPTRMARNSGWPGFST